MHDRRTDKSQHRITKNGWTTECHLRCFRFPYRNIRHSAFSGERAHRFFVTMLPASLNRHSDGTDVAVMHSISLATWATSGWMLSRAFHQDKGSSLIAMAFSPRYFSTFREASECTSVSADSAVAAAATVATTAVQGPKSDSKLSLLPFVEEDMQMRLQEWSH